MYYRFVLTAMLTAAITVSGIALAGELNPVLIISRQQFEPQELVLSPAVKLKLIIRNIGKLPAEFESDDLSCEVVVPGNSEVTIYVGPLAPGRYQFFNDFNHAMQGVVVVTQPAAGR